MTGMGFAILNLRERPLRSRRKGGTCPLMYSRARLGLRGRNHVGFDLLGCEYRTYRLCGCA